MWKSLPEENLHQLYMCDTYSNPVRISGAGRETENKDNISINRAKVTVSQKYNSSPVYIVYKSLKRKNEEFI